MLTDRTTRSFFAASLLVVGLMIAINLMLRPEGLVDWTWIAGFAALAGAGALAVTLWLEDRAGSQSGSRDDAAVQSTATQDWIISKDVLPAPSISSASVNSATHANSAAHASNATPTLTEPLVEEDAPTIDTEVVSATIIEPTPASIREEHSVTLPTNPVHEVAAANAVGEDAPIIEEAQQGEPIAEKEVGDAMAAEVPPEVPQAKSQAAAKSAGGIGVIPAAIPDADDLKRIEGIGPAYSEALQKAGISSFTQLSQASRETIEAAIRKAGYTRIPGSASTWAEQAKLASEGKWDEFQTLQDSLRGGRR